MSEPLTAGDMIEELQKVPADTVLDWYGHGNLEFFEVEKDGRCYIEADSVASITADVLSLDASAFESLQLKPEDSEPDMTTRVNVEGTPVADLPIEVQKLLDASAETAEAHSTGADSTLNKSAQPQPASEPHSGGHVHPAVLSVVGVLSFLALAWVVVMVGKR